jgi:hypothetical protein
MAEVFLETLLPTCHDGFVRCAFEKAARFLDSDTARLGVNDHSLSAAQQERSNADEQILAQVDAAADSD